VELKILYVEQSGCLNVALGYSALVIMDFGSVIIECLMLKNLKLDRGIFLGDYIPG